MVRMQKTTGTTRKPRTKRATPARGVVKKTIIDLKEEEQSIQDKEAEQPAPSDQPDTQPQKLQPEPQEPQEPQESQEPQQPQSEPQESQEEQKPQPEPQKPQESQKPQQPQSQTEEREEKIKRLQYQVYNRGGYVKQRAKKELKYMGAGW